jgi:PAC2 family
MGSIPAAVPHTAPTPVMRTTSKDEEGEPEGLLRVPAACVSAVEWTIAQNGIPAVGFWAQVPHYASPYAAGAIALIRRIETHLTVTIGAGELEEEDARQRAAMQEIIAANPEAQAYLERLESMAGEQEIPEGENIAEEVERFLRNRRPGSGPSPFSPE